MNPEEINKEAEAQREVLNTLVKLFEKRIKAVQQEMKDACTQEDVWIKQGVENELIGWKIYLERLRKKLKYDGLRHNSTN